MKLTSILCLSALLCLTTSSLFAVDSIRTIEEYDSALPYWGVTWNPGDNTVPGTRYYPGFYTGFAPRMQYPNRIHIRTARGNQTRITVTLDNESLNNYLFDLAKRYEVYKKFTTAPEGRKPLVKTNLAKNDRFIPHVEMFYQIMESPVYGILEFVESAKAGRESKESIYAKSLEVMSLLNYGRVFNLNLDLNQEFTKWKSTVAKLLDGKPATEVLTVKSSATVIALDTLLFGRINVYEEPSADLLAQLQEAATLAVTNANEDAFMASALKLFKMATGSKYDFQVLNASGNFEDAIQCADLSSCRLNYTEFTTINPTGSAEDWTSDEFGNRITFFYTPGLWQFLAYSGKDFDNIRKEPYYAWVPKMDFEGIGNGFHNPAVTFWSRSKSANEVLNLPSDQQAFNSVKRGGVSHGCLRMPPGHVWELRHILPVQNSVATKVKFYGNNSTDFDIYDIDGNGTLEVMGVEYLISYSVSEANRRDGGTLEISADQKLKFYENLYGRKNVFTYENGEYTFQNPWTSMVSYLDAGNKGKGGTKTRYKLEGNFPLYEQKYTRDKLQFYRPIVTEGLIESSQSYLSKRIVRLMGRIRGCAPDADKEVCGEAAFDSEAAKIWNEAY
jgi:hypothetical protein